MECLKNGTIPGVVGDETWAADGCLVENRLMVDSCTEWMRQHRAYTANLTSNAITRVVGKFGVQKKQRGNRRLIVRPLEGESEAFLAKYGVASFEEQE